MCIIIHNVSHRFITVCPAFIGEKTVLKLTENIIPIILLARTFIAAPRCSSIGNRQHTT